MSTLALNNLWEFLLGQGLSASNERWLAEHLIEHAESRERTELQPYTMAEINAMIDEAEEDFRTGQIYTEAEATKMMRDFVTQLA